MKTPNGADLGRAIRRLRHARKITIETLAFAADMHPTYLSGIERDPSCDCARRDCRSRTRSTTSRRS
jgi:hypothetical protein